MVQLIYSLLALNVYTMEVLSRHDVIEQLRAATQGQLDAQRLAQWAFDQFYAEEQGTLEFEPGYRRAIGAVLDDLMFGDERSFQLTDVELQRLIRQLEQAEAQPDTHDSEDEDENDYP